MSTRNESESSVSSGNYGLCLLVRSLPSGYKKTHTLARTTGALRAS